MTTRLQHPRRFLVLAACLGPVYSLALDLGAYAWAAFPEFRLFVLRGASGAALCAFTSTCVAWWLRRMIAEADPRRASYLAVITTWTGGAVYMFGLTAWETLRDLAGGSVDGVWLAALVAAPVFGAIFSTPFLLVTLPLGWVAILLLRRASGGLVCDGPAPLNPSSA